MGKERDTMSQNKKKTTKRKMDLTGKIILIGGIIILVPILIFGWILISASLSTGKPIFGNRYDGDLDPAITSAEIKTIETSIEGLSGVESASVNLISATLRITVDVEDSANEEVIRTKLDEIYNAVTSTLAVETYFTSTSTMRMYDLEINIHNLPTSESASDSFVLVGRVKNAMMAEYVDQLLSEPNDAELAQELRDDVEARLNPTATPDDEMTVGGLDDGNEAIPEATPTPEVEGGE